MSDGRKRIGIQLPLGFSSGLPLLLTGGTLTAWLKDDNVDMVAIGAFAWVALPYNFKFLWAPLMDRFSLPWLGRRRGWIVLTQLLLFAALMVMGTVDAGGSPQGIAVIAVAVAFLSASQDVVVDAYRTDVLDTGQRGKGTATYVTGYRLATIVAGAGALLLADYTSWRVTYWIMAGLMLACIAGTLAAPEPERVHEPASLRAAVVEPWSDFFSRRGAVMVILIVALYRFGESMAGHMVTPFLLDIGFSKAEIGAVQKFGGMIATLLGAGLGGAMVDRLGAMRTLIWFGALQALANIGYVFLATSAEPSHTGLVAAIFIDHLCTGMGVAAFVAFLMSLCSDRYSATQYALLASASTILGRLFGASSGYIQGAIGWDGFFGVTIVVAVPALLLLVWYRKRIGAMTTDKSREVT